jgi:pimeloyl-ACP methyl ester carboxylesterase
LERLHE